MTVPIVTVPIVTAPAVTAPVVTPILVACSHGTSSAAGQAAISGLVEQARELRPGTDVREAFVDVQEPTLPAVLDACPSDNPIVVVPLLLSTGYHTRVDIAQAVAAHPGNVTATPALGPHELIADVLLSRLTAVDLRPGDAVVLAAAGSTDPAAEGDVRATADRLSALVGRRVGMGFASGRGQRIGAAVARARAEGAARVVVASYVLAPGHFADLIARSGADVVTPPLAPDERLAAVVAERFTAEFAGHAVRMQVS